MFFSSWLRKWITTTGAKRPGPQRKPARFRPRLEALEDRAVPAVLNVTTALDLIDPNDGVLSLREAIQQANPATSGGDTIMFDSSLNGQTITLNGNELLINKTLNIQGPGADQLGISGNFRGSTGGPYSRVIEVASGVQLSLTGLTIRGGYAHGTGQDRGGAIYSSGKLTVSGCTFSENCADDRGGAIYSLGESLTVTNSVFTDFNFSGSVGGGIYCFSGQTSISSTIFTGSESYSAGAAIYNNTYSTLTLTNCTLSSNLSWHGAGGAIFNYGGLTASGCRFTGNATSSPFGGGTNGNIGGAITNYGTATISGSTFSANRADLSGGAIWAGGTTTLTGCIFTDNVAAVDGGGIYGGGKLTVSGCTISGNTASGGSGGGILSRGNDTISSTTLSNNIAHLKGGGLYSMSTALTVSGSTFTGNTASLGGAIYSAPAGGGSLTVSGCTISGNSADNGGGIYNAYVFKATLTIKDSTISGNTATSNGGGLYNNGAASVQNTTVSNNSAGLQGGGIFNDSDGTLTLYASGTLTGNLAPNGADIFNLGRVTKKK